MGRVSVTPGVPFDVPLALMFGRGRVAPCLIRVCVSCEHGRGFDSSCLGCLVAAGYVVSDRLVSGLE